MTHLYLTAGMPRSASTWLYNAVRLILRRCGHDDLGAGWVGDFNTFKRHATVLVKIHDFQPVLAQHATGILYSFRDIRDSLASSLRKFGTQPTFERAAKLLEQDRIWRQQAGFLMRYEDMMRKPAVMIGRLAAFLHCAEVDPADIGRQIDGFDFASGPPQDGPYNRENLLHRGHITDGRHGS